MRLAEAGQIDARGKRDVTQAKGGIGLAPRGARGGSMEDDRNRKQERDEEEMGRSNEDIADAEDEFDDEDQVDQDVDEEDMEEK
jgi:hypothetical protein